MMLLLKRCKLCLKNSRTDVFQEMIFNFNRPIFDLFCSVFENFDFFGDGTKRTKRVSKTTDTNSKSGTGNGMRPLHVLKLPPRIWTTTFMTSLLQFMIGEYWVVMQIRNEMYVSSRFSSTSFRSQLDWFLVHRDLDGLIVPNLEIFTLNVFHVEQTNL